MRESFLAVTLGSALLLSAERGLAQPDTKTVLAEALYQQARALMDAGQLDEACPKFAESYRLDPATGTLLNLAACHERQGRLATAWLEFTDAVAAARRDGREDRVRYAQERLAEIEPKLSRLTIVVAPEAQAPDLEIELNGARVGSAALGVPAPVDPGPHEVRASAPGKLPWEAVIEIGAVADRQTVTIPALQPDPAAESARPAPTTTPISEPPSPGRGTALDSRPIPTSVYVLGGITLLLAGGAGVTGALYLSKKESYRASGNESDWDAANGLGVVNGALWAATAVGAGVTTYLYVTRPTRAYLQLPERSRTAEIVPWYSGRAGGVSVSGRFE
jgi:tetratricopeptide (TPR) repeat protein